MLLKYQHCNIGTIFHSLRILVVSANRPIHITKLKVKLQLQVCQASVYEWKH